MRKSFPIFLLALLPMLVLAQPKENNPYSSFGLGTLSPTVFANQTGMGGLAAAWNDPFHLNFENPASLAALRATAFETGLFAQRSEQKSATASLTDWRGNLTHVAIGFPLKSPINEVLDKKKSPYALGMGFALSPFSTVGFVSKNVKTGSGLGQTVQNFQGQGGLYQFRWGNAIKYENLSVGLNLGYIFGKLDYENWGGTTQDSLPTFIDVFKNNYSVRGFNWNLGVQYDAVLKENSETHTPTETLTFGLTANGKRHLSANGESQTIRARARDELGALTLPDTISTSSFTKAAITLPAELGFGMMYQKINKLKIGFQYSLANWNVYKNEARPARLYDAQSFSAGLEWIPSAKSFGNYAKRMRYRTGFYWKRDPRQVSGSQVDDLGVSVGLGLPVVLPRQGTSFVNFALEIGKLGRSTPLVDSYARLTVGFTLNDNSWFYKRRFE